MKKLIICLCSALLICSCALIKNSVPSEDNDIVNTGYSKVSHSDRTDSSTKVKVKDKDTKTYSDIYELLLAKVPGLQIGPNNTLRLRGDSSINASNVPLIVVDGVISDNISNINPIDVKDIDVLKGSAAAIYGARGANGVILIYLK